MRSLLLSLLGVFVLGSRGAAQCEVQTLLPPDPDQGFGPLLAQDGACFAVASGTSIYVYEQIGRTAYLQQRLLFPEFDGITYIRSLALDGDTLAFGIYSSSPTPKSVRVLERQAGTWSEVARLVHAGSDVEFGESLALDGERLAIGAPDEGSTPILTGAVYLYERTAGVWTPAERLAPQVARMGERFGWALDLEGDRLAVGGLPIFFSGEQERAYVFDKTSSGWQQSVLTPANRGVREFGEALDLRGDALIVGDSSATGGGRAWIFERDGTSWIETGELTQAGTDNVFGFADSVALSEDGSLAMVASAWDSDPLVRLGGVHVFEKSAGAWQRAEKIVPVRPSFGAFFGLHIRCEGDLAVVSGSGFVTTVSVRETLCRTLFAQPESISLTSGGRQTLRLSPGTEFAGKRFLLMGSASGFDPGLRVRGARVPLVPDAYLRASLPGQRLAPFVNNLGVLGATAPQAEVTIDVPPGSALALAGLTLTHAFVVLDHGSVVHVSNFRTLALVP